MTHPILHIYPHDAFFRKYLELRIRLHSLETILNGEENVKYVEIYWVKNTTSLMKNVLSVLVSCESLHVTEFEISDIHICHLFSVGICIAQRESGLNTAARSKRNSVRSRDNGIFQVNTRFFCLALQPSSSYGLLGHEVFVITHNDAPQSVGLVWTSDQLVAETST
jgi:hypothetical protein